MNRTNVGIVGLLAGLLLLPAAAAAQGAGDGCVALESRSLRPGGAAVVRGVPPPGVRCGDPGAPVTVELANGSVVLGRTTADSDGGYPALAMEVPDGIPAGTHTLRVRTVVDALPVTYTRPVTVAPGSVPAGHSRGGDVVGLVALVGALAAAGIALLRNAWTRWGASLWLSPAGEVPAPGTEGAGPGAKPDAPGAERVALGAESRSVGVRAPMRQRTPAPAPRAPGAPNGSHASNGNGSSHASNGNGSIRPATRADRAWERAQGTASMEDMLDALISIRDLTDPERAAELDKVIGLVRLRMGADQT